jgi:hypothetical protein
MFSVATLFFQLSKAAAERCEEAQHDFAIEIGAIPPESLVAADEAAVNVLTMYRTNGWSLQGLRARKRCCFVRGMRYVVFCIPCSTTFMPQ